MCGLASAAELVKPEKTAVKAPELEVLPRTDWAPEKHNESLLTKAKSYHRITLHHEGARVFSEKDKSSVAAEIGRVYNAHKNLGYGDIGYHLVVDYAGRVWGGRSLGYWGAHVSGENEGNIAVMALGNFQEQRPSVEQNAAVITLVKGLKARYKIKGSRVYGHCDLGYTICPGRYLYPAVNEGKREKTR